jgi:hypothetical protein
MKSFITLLVFFSFFYLQGTNLYGQSTDTVNETAKQIDVSSFNSGWYSVALMCDGNLKDAKLVYIN